MQHTQQLFLEALKAALKNEQVEWNNKLEAQEWMDLFRMAEVHQILPMIYEAVYRSPAAGQADPQILAPAKAQMVRTVIMQTQKTVNTQAAGEYPIEFRVMDSGGNTVYLKTQISISDKSYAGIDVKLKDYLIYLSVGDAFDPNAYFDSADKEGELTMQSNVNTAKAGSYYVDYIVNAGAISGKSRLVVVVQ